MRTVVDPGRAVERSDHGAARHQGWALGLVLLLVLVVIAVVCNQTLPA
jgi:hypothetical protein